MKALWSIIKTVYVTIMTVYGLAWICAWSTEDGKEGLSKMMRNL